MKRSGKQQKFSDNCKRSKGVGCMPGFFHLFHRHACESKRLTLGEKPEPSPNHLTKFTEIITSHFPGDTNSRKLLIKPSFPTSPAGKPANSLPLSDKISRSPSLPTEIRHEGTECRPDKAQRKLGVVAHLMGLHDFPAELRCDLPESDTEKRRKILGALEKCDADLRAVKKVIESITPSTVAKIDGGALAEVEGLTLEDKLDEKNSGEMDGEESSPVSVLDERFLTYRGLEKEITAAQKNDKDQKPREVTVVHDIIRRSPKSSNKLHVLMDNEADMDDAKAELCRAMEMVKYMDDVFKDIAWKEKWEYEKIGLALEDRIFRELIEDIITELGNDFKPYLSLFKCRKRLCF